MGIRLRQRSRDPPARGRDDHRPGDVAARADQAKQRFLYNAQNRVVRALKIKESTGSWTYSSTTFQQANAATANRIEVLMGMPSPEDILSVEVQHFASNGGSGVHAAAGVGLDNTTNVADVFGGYLGSAGHLNLLRASYRAAMTIGYHAINSCGRSSPAD